MRTFNEVLDELEAIPAEAETELSAQLNSVYVQIMELRDSLRSSSRMFSEIMEE